jgi:type II secretory pathway component PulK
MTVTTFHFHSTPTGKPKVMTLNAIDVAARYFVYKLYEATDGQPMQWATLRGMDESRATVARAIERGWVVLQGVGGKPLDRKAALTGDGRRLARKGR